MDFKESRHKGGYKNGGEIEVEYGGQILRIGLKVVAFVVATAHGFGCRRFGAARGCLFVQRYRLQQAATIMPVNACPHRSEQHLNGQGNMNELA